MRDWLRDIGATGTPGELLEALMTSLVAGGIPVARVATGVMTRHPEIALENLQYSRDHGLVRHLRPHHYRQLDIYVGSPVQAIHAGVDEIRRRLPNRPGEFTVLDELHAVGLRDYVAFALPTSAGRSFISFATAAEAGFSNDALGELRALVPWLTLRMDAAIAQSALRSLLQVYLGRNAAERVLAGAFRRGGGESLRAAIWFCDMRDFTAFADTRPPSEVVAVLDRLFELLAEHIAAGGGEILKFVGDAVLAVFPIGDDAAVACARALTAAQAALAALAATAEPLLARARIGVALHVGDVFYGNLGAHDRLDFTVIGAAVNEVCRLESLCKPLDEPLLVSRAFAEQLGVSSLRSLGAQVLKGVAAPLEVFAPAR